MLLKLFKSNHPYVIFLIPLLGFILWLPAFFNLPLKVQTLNFENTTFLFNWVNELLSFNTVVAKLVAFSLVIGESYILLRLNFSHIFIENKTYLPSVLFVLFSSVLAPFQQLYPLLIANLFLLLAINKAFLIDKNRNQFKRYFESGFYLGLGSLFYPNIYIFIFIIWLTQIVLRNFNWREWISSIFGLVTPFVFFMAILFLNNEIDGVFTRFFSILTHSSQVLSFSSISIGAVGFLLFIIFIALIIGLRTVAVKKISSRKYFTLFTWFLLYTIVLFLAHPSVGYELLIALAIPSAIISSVFFTEIRSKWVSEIIFGLTLLAVFAIIWLQ